MISTFDCIGKVTIAGLCLGFAFLRGARLPIACSEIAGWFETHVGDDQLVGCLSRMVDRGWLEPQFGKAGYALTETGEDVVEQAFKGFVRFIDARENRWDVGMMFQIAKTHYDRRKN